MVIRLFQSVAALLLFPAVASAQSMPSRFDLLCTGQRQVMEIGNEENPIDEVPPARRLRIDFSGLRWCEASCRVTGNIEVQQGIIGLIDPPSMFSGGTSFRWPLGIVQHVRILRGDVMIIKQYTCEVLPFSGGMPRANP